MCNSQCLTGFALAGIHGSGPTKSQVNDTGPTAVSNKNDIICLSMKNNEVSLCNNIIQRKKILSRSWNKNVCGIFMKLY